MNIHEWLGEDISPKALDQAVDWIAILDAKVNDEEFSEQQAKFYQWLGQAPVNQYAFAELSEIWAKTACLDKLKSTIETSKVIDFPQAEQNSNGIWPEQPLLADSMICSSSSSPAWLYEITLATITLGFVLAFVF